MILPRNRDSRMTGSPKLFAYRLKPSVFSTFKGCMHIFIAFRPHCFLNFLSFLCFFSIFSRRTLDLLSACYEVSFDLRSIFSPTDVLSTYFTFGLLSACSRLAIGLLSTFSRLSFILALGLLSACSRLALDFFSTFFHPSLGLLSNRLALGR
jgi:hypothetical protein